MSPPCQPLERVWTHHAAACRTPMNSCRVVLIVLRERLWRFCVKARTAVFASTSLTITLLVGWALIGALHTTPGTGPGDDGRYLVRGPGYTVLLDTDGPVVMLREPQPAARFGTLGTLARRRTLRSCCPLRCRLSCGRGRCCDGGLPRWRWPFARSARSAPSASRPTAAARRAPLRAGPGVMQVLRPAFRPGSRARRPATPHRPCRRPGHRARRHSGRAGSRSGRSGRAAARPCRRAAAAHRP